jgi:hypothetical protein
MGLEAVTGENDDKDETGKTARVVTLVACSMDDSGSSERIKRRHRGKEEK